MDSVKLFGVLLSAVILSSCQVTYLTKSAYHQAKLLYSRVAIEDVLKESSTTPEQKRKLELVLEAKNFAEKNVGLTQTKNYTSFVQLDQSHVTFAVSAAPKWKLEHHYWNYPLVGKMPYKGYFKKEDAETEKADLEKKNLDTYLRGISAYSTLGWFDDPILSSMMGYQDHDLVNLIIHETTHATLFIKHAADFNERMATFVGNKGTELFYLQKEGPQSPTLQQIQNENYDEAVFSKFITEEIQQLEIWYKELKTPHDESTRKNRIQEIQTRFSEKIKPQLKTKNYEKFDQIELNNARLLVYKTYMQDLQDFENLYNKLGQDFHKFIEACRKLENSKQPELDLKKL